MANRKLNPSNCNLFCREVSFLGHSISTEGARRDPYKISAVEDWNSPEDVHKFLNILGLCTYYKRFVKCFSSNARPLQKLTTNN